MQKSHNGSDRESRLCLLVVLYFCEVHFSFQHQRLQIGLHYLPEKRKFHVAIIGRKKEVRDALNSVVSCG